MFGATIQTLLSRQSHRVNHKVFTVACALLLCSTAVRVSFHFPAYVWGKYSSLVQHIVIDIIRAMEGLILYRDTYPGGPVAFFADVSQWTFVAKNYAFTVQTLLGDGVVVSFVFDPHASEPRSMSALQLYRCYMVWQSKAVMILPVLLWCATFGALNASGRSALQLLMTPR